MIATLKMLSDRIRWTNLRSVGNSAAAKATIFIPLVGYLILFNDDLLKYINLWNRLFERPDSSVSFRLLCLYFGLCLIAFASVVYAIFCPREIKSHGSSAEFVGGESENLSVNKLIEISELLTARKRNDVDFAAYSEELKERRYMKGLDDHRKNNVEAETKGLERYFESQDLQFPAARVAAVALYAFGFLLLLVPSADVFWRALKLLLESFGS